ncbi:DUF6625 family protein [Methylobacillus rhizosphaerae]
MEVEKPNTIRIIIPYFGNWPFWMPVFLESCRYNSTIDWLIYTDCTIPKNCPDNVKVIQVSFRAYCTYLSSRLQMDFYPDSAYKLCDIKPMLGHVHHDEIAGYDFWGFGDIDVVYGNLRAYFTRERLSHYDLFSMHARRISGHLCLLRNTPEMNTAFQKVSNWPNMLADHAHVAFDEKAFSKIFLRHKNSAALVQWLAKKIDPWLEKAEFNETYTTPNARIKWRNDSGDFPEKWYWSRGQVSNDLDQGYYFPYFHFMEWKKGWDSANQELKDFLATTDAKVEIDCRGMRVVG